VRTTKGYHNYIDLYGKYLLRFHHGEKILYRGGIGGVTIPANKAVGQWNKIKHAYLDLFGHFHYSHDFSSFMVNGSLIGYNAYAMQNKFDPERPLQMFFCIEREKGKTFTGPIFLG